MKKVFGILVITLFMSGSLNAAIEEYNDCEQQAYDAMEKYYDMEIFSDCDVILLGNVVYALCEGYNEEDIDAGC